MNKLNEIDTEEHLEGNAEIERLHDKVDDIFFDPEPEKNNPNKAGTRVPGEDETREYTISFTMDELEVLTNALCAKQRMLDAEKYIRGSLNQDPKIKSHVRWRTVAEIMGFKEPNRDVSRWGHKNREIYAYYYYFHYEGLHPNAAAVKVNKDFGFPSQDACNTWLYNEITRQQKEDKSGTCAGLKRPQKSFV